MAIEESLNLDISGALAAIRGDLKREVESIPDTLRSAFDAVLTAMAGDVGAFASLAKEEIDRVLGTPIDVPVEVDTSAVDAAAETIDAAGQPIEAPVEVDTSDVDRADREIQALDGETIDVAVDVDTASIDQAQEQIDGLSGSIEGAGGAARGAGHEIGLEALGVKELAGSFTELGGSAVAAGVATGGILAGIGLFAEKAIGAQAAIHSFELRTGDLAETLNRVDVADLNISLADLAVKVGASGNAMRLALAQFTQLSEGSGKTRKEVGDLGQSLSALGAYLSVTNPRLGSADEIIQRLPTALARGGRFLANYGLVLTTTEIQQRALADNTGKTAAELTIFDKAAAGLALSMEKYGSRLKEGIAEGSQLAEIRLKSLQAQFNLTAVAAGKPLVEPVISALEELQPILIDVAKIVGQVGGAFVGVLGPALHGVALVATPLADTLGKIPKPLLEAGAAAYIAAKGIAVLEAAATLVSGALTGALAALTATEGPLATHAAAQATAATATAANVVAQEALQVAQGEAVAFATADAGAEAALAVAHEAAAATAATETVALEALAVAEGEATTALGPIAIVATAVAATLGVLTHRSDDLGIKLKDFAKFTSGELVRAFDKFQAIGEGTRFFKELAAQSTETATELRDGLAQQGRDVTEFTKILDEAAAHEAEAAKGKALSSKEIKEYTAALEDGDLAAKSDAANALFSSLAYEGLAPKVQETVKAIVDKEAADKKAEVVAAANAAAIQAEADAAKNAATGFSDALSALNNLLGVTVSSQKQGLDFAIVLDKLAAKQTEAAAKGGAAAAGYKLETAAGRENIAALVDQVKAQADLVGKNVEAGESAKTATDRYRTQVDALGKVAGQAGLTTTQYEGLLKQYGLTPDQLLTDVKLVGLDEAKVTADRFKSELEKLPVNIRAKLTLDEIAFFEAIDRVKAKLAEVGPSSGNQSFAAEFAAANIPVLKEYGGVVRNPRAAARGGSTAGLYEQSSGVLFNEPSAMGEAFIPLNPDRRDRATAVLGDVATKFGYSLVPTSASRAPLSIPSTSAAGSVQGGGVAVLERIASLLDKLPDRLPAGVTANVDLSVEESDVLGRLAQRLRGH